ncbi:MAG: T9SS type A sorting domain-containing protein [Candidatus Cloacimonetes bacterium]|nr:T9SS type A sorting domain-containing protein [Candidatus Cloacimonadota bacterium]
MGKLVILSIFLGAVILLSAQWSTDPEFNNQISNLGGDQTICKNAQLPDGSCYFGWWSNSTGNYNMRLQYLDAEGNEVWEQNGILISDHTQMTWLTDWDMTVDLEGNAIMAINDIRVNEDQLDIIAYKISPDGEFLWGDDGINLSNGGFNVAPKVTVTENNYCIYAWADDYLIQVISISPTGNLTWDQPIIIDYQDTSNWPQLIPATNDDSEGNFLLKYYVNTGPFWAPDRAIYLQKYDAEGNPVWDSPAVVSDAFGISAWTQDISFTTDGSGGAVLAWYDDRFSENTTRAYVQHITTDGTALFDDGVLVADHAPNQMFYPAVVYQPETEMIYVYWSETDAGQNVAGIIGQKINADGELLYTNTGVVISPLQASGGPIIGLRPLEDDFAVIYSVYPWGGFTNEQILAERVDSEGNLVWNETLIISDMQTQKLHPDLTDVRWTDEGYIPNNSFIVSWGSGTNGIFAQRFNYNGTIGGPPNELPAPLNLTAELDIYTVTLQWDMPDDRALLGFQVYRNDELLAEISDPAAREFEDSVDEFIIYEYYVVAVHDEGCSLPSNTAAVTVMEVPFPPAGLIVDNTTGILEWLEPDIPLRSLDGYNLYLDDMTAPVDHVTETTYQFNNLVSGQTYLAGVSAVYTDAISEVISIEFVYENVAGDDNDICTKVALLGNHPNPFNPSTSINFQLAQPGDISLNIYNCRGQLVKTLYSGYAAAGTHHFNWDAANQSSGIYYYTLAAQDITLKSKMLLIK